MLLGDETMVGANKLSCGNSKVIVHSIPTIKDFHKVTPATTNYISLLIFCDGFITSNFDP